MVNWLGVGVFQKINHFPGMAEICRKDLLARNMNRMVKLFPKDYSIFPKSWCLPAEYVHHPSSIILLMATFNRSLIAKAVVPVIF